MAQNRRTWIFAATLAFVTLLATDAQAGTPSSRLEGRARSGRAEIKATYELKGTRRKFSTEITRGTSNVTVTVTASRGNVALGTWSVRTNAVGFADLNRDTSSGQQVPNLQVGDIVQLSVGSTVVARIPLQAR